MLLLEIKHKVMVRKSEGMRSLAKARRRREDNIKDDLKAGWRVRS
jgi:hypothetical protein